METRRLTWVINGSPEAERDALDRLAAEWGLTIEGIGIFRGDGHSEVWVLLHGDANKIDILSECAMLNLDPTGLKDLV